MREQSHSIILGLRTDPIGIGLADQFKYVCPALCLMGYFFSFFASVVILTEMLMSSCP